MRHYRDKNNRLGLSKKIDLRKLTQKEILTEEYGEKYITKDIYQKEDLKGKVFLSCIPLVVSIIFFFCVPDCFISWIFLFCGLVGTLSSGIPLINKLREEYSENKIREMLSKYEEESSKKD